MVENSAEQSIHAEFDPWYSGYLCTRPVANMIRNEMENS